MNHHTQKRISGIFLYIVGVIRFDPPQFHASISFHTADKEPPLATTENQLFLKQLCQFFSGKGRDPLAKVEIRHDDEDYSRSDMVHIVLVAKHIIYQIALSGTRSSRV